MKSKFFRRLIKYFITVSCFILVSTSVYGAWYDNAEWYDHYYQYRIPVEATVASGGLQILDITPDTIASTINQLEEIHHSDRLFDYNRVRLVEYDNSGNIIDVIDSAGFYLSYTSSEMIYNGDFESESGGVASGWSWNYIGAFLVVPGLSHDGSKCLRIQTETMDRNRINQPSLPIAANTHYILSFWANGTQKTYGPSAHLSDMVDPWNKSVNGKSYMHYMRSSYWKQYEMIFREQSAITAQVNIERTLTGTAYIDDVSLRKASIDLLFDPGSTGAKKYMIYYQPSQSWSAVIPENRIDTAPITAASPSFIGSAERYDSIAKYTLHTSSDYDVWFAETTQKITPLMAIPANTGQSVNIESALNEKQSFQLVIKPKNNMVIDTATLGALSSGSDTISADQSYTKILGYVSMAQKSDDAFNLVPRAGDMLEAFTSQNLFTDSESLALWTTVIVPPDSDPGLYSGYFTFSGTVTGSPFTRSIPVSLTVHKFGLPDRVKFRTSHGTGHFSYRFNGGNSIYDFHGATSGANRDTIVRGYYDAMCENKVYPFTIATGSVLSYLWDAPPHGYNIDLPGNYFYVYDFDFDSFNDEVSYWIDTYDVNSFTVAHTNGDYMNKFNLVNPSQLVAWDEPDTSFKAITRLQFDNLVVDYWREIAYNLILNGWIDRVYYSIDETSVAAYPKMAHTLRVLKSDPYTAQIKTQFDIDKITAYFWKEHPDTETDPTFKGLVDIWTPENNELLTFYEDHYFTENNMDPAEEDIWCYYTDSSHLNIDTHGINNRVLPVKNFFMNSTGFLDWGAFIYEDPGAGIQNPRIDPWVPHGNGSLAYLYPPGDTVPASFDPTITPSARLEMFREGIEDYEYMYILDNWVDTAAANSIDTSNAAYLREEMHRMFDHPIRWSANDEYYLLLRKQIMEEIDNLMWYSTYGEPAAEILKIARDGSDVNISLYAKEIYRYNLLRSDDLANPNWQTVDTALVTSGDTITLTDNSIGGAQKAFYKVQAVIP